MGEVVLPDESVRIVRAQKANGNRVVFTNGCFDLLHPGHVQLLTAAGACGEFLIVALNSDASVGRLKGPGRPVIPEGDRAALLAALRPVDAVCIFNDADAVPLLRLLRPDVYVKGEDYRGRGFPELEVARELGIAVVFAPLARGYSTSSLIERIRGSKSKTETSAGPVHD